MLPQVVMWIYLLTLGLGFLVTIIKKSKIIAFTLGILFADALFRFFSVEM